MDIGMSMLFARLSIAFPMILSSKTPIMVSSSRNNSKVEVECLVKHNKTTQGLVSTGQCARDVNLFTIEGQPTTLFSQMVDGQPLVLLAGSTS